MSVNDCEFFVVICNFSQVLATLYNFTFLIQLSINVKRVEMGE